MARVEITKPDVGTTSASVVNAVFTAISTQTTNVDEENFAEEGLDYRALEASISAEATERFTTNSSGTQALTATYATLNFNGSPVSIPSSGTIEVATNERLRVTCCLEFFSNATQSGIPTDTDVEVRLMYDVGAGGVGVSQAYRRLYPATASDPSPAANEGCPHRLRWSAMLNGSLSIQSLYVEIRDNSGNNNTVQLQSATLHGIILKRVTV